VFPHFAAGGIEAMAESDHAKRAKAYLEDQCDRLDRGEGLARGNWASVCFPALAPVVLGLTLGCIDGGHGLYGVPFDDPCTYHRDDAGVRVPDCEEPECAKSYACREAESEAGPPRENCANGKDDTGNGLIDCEDPVCASYHACRDVVAYAAPPKEICDNGKDDNSDGRVDCDDPQCEDHPGCAEDL